MATLQSLQLEVDNLKQQLSELLSNSREPKDITITSTVDEDGYVVIQNTGQDVQVITPKNLFFQMLKSLGMVDINSNGDMSGATVFGIPTGARSSINNGNLIMGWRVLPNVPDPTTDNDFETPYGLGQ